MKRHQCQQCYHWKSQQDRSHQLLDNYLMSNTLQCVLHMLYFGLSQKDFKFCQLFICHAVKARFHHGPHPFLILYYRIIYFYVCHMQQKYGWYIHLGKYVEARRHWVSFCIALYIIPPHRNVAFWLDWLFLESAFFCSPMQGLYSLIDLPHCIWILEVLIQVPVLAHQVVSHTESPPQFIY